MNKNVKVAQELVRLAKELTGRSMMGGDFLRVMSLEIWDANYCEIGAEISTRTGGVKTVAQITKLGESLQKTAAQHMAKLKSFGRVYGSDSGEVFLEPSGEYKLSVTATFGIQVETKFIEDGSFFQAAKNLGYDVSSVERRINSD